MSKTIAYVILAFILSSACQDVSQAFEVNYSKNVVSVPTLFAQDVISTEENSEFDIAFSQNGRKAYFSRRAPEEKQRIYESQFADGYWSKAKLAEFSTDRDETASISPDGKYLFFGSERPIPDKENKGNFDMNIWMMKKTVSGWGEPSPLPEPINNV